MQISLICYLCLAFWSSFGVFFWGLLFFFFLGSSSLFPSSCCLVVCLFLWQSSDIGGLVLRRRCIPVIPFLPLPSHTIACIDAHPMLSSSYPPAQLSAAPIIPASRPSYWRHMLPHYRPLHKAAKDAAPPGNASNAGVAHSARIFLFCPLREVLSRMLYPRHICRALLAI